jgi:hydroxymethylpyrimidine/phosphomethylpyrimidine kinase
MHESYCASWGIEPAALLAAEESAATTAYGAYILDVGTKGDALDLLVALAACLLGYGEVGLWLKSEAEKPDSWVKLECNPYRKFVVPITPLAAAILTRVILWLDGWMIMAVRSISKHA